MRTQNENNVNDKNIETYIGVDVAKATLGIHRFAGERNEHFY